MDSFETLFTLFPWRPWRASRARLSIGTGCSHQTRGSGMSWGSCVTFVSFVSRASGRSLVTFTTLHAVSSGGPLRSGWSRLSLVAILAIFPRRTWVSFVPWDSWKSRWSRGTCRAV